MQGKFDVQRVAYHFPVRGVGDGVDVPVVELVADRGDWGHGRGGGDGRVDRRRRVHLLNRHVGRRGGCFGGEGGLVGGVRGVSMLLEDGEML